MSRSLEITRYPNPVAAGLHLQLPLGIPDYHRRSKIKPQPIRPVVYFGEELRATPVNRPERAKTSSH